MMWLVYGFGATYALWLFYLAVMNLKRARDAGTLSKPAHALGLPLFAIGITIDALVNIVVCSIIMLEAPRELLVTSRLNRHLKGKGWRQRMAAWFCTHLLDAFDPSGCHCKKS